MAKNELSKAEWLSKAQAYCARAEHCAADVRRKLYEWGAPSDLFDFIEKNLYDNDFLNDRRFCMAYVHDKVAYQRWGRMKIQVALQALQLSHDAISYGLANIDEEQYMQNLNKLINSRPADPPEKLLRFLLQRGYTPEEIKKCI